MSKDFLNLNHARTDEQKALMEKIEEDGVCPFCWEHFEKYHPKPVLKKTDWWIVTENMSPYGNARIHYIFVYKEHITSPSELTKEGILDLFDLMKTIEEEQEIPGGAMMMRFGDTRYTGGSVTHLHAHLISGNKKEDGGDAIRVKVGYGS